MANLWCVYTILFSPLHFPVLLYARSIDGRRPCFEDELNEWSNLYYKVTNQFDAVLNDKL